MQTASFTTVIETIFYIVLFYYIFKFVMRLLLPVAMKKMVEKAEETLRNQSQQHYHNTGETIYETPKSQKPRGPGASEQAKQTSKVGEYVDFEELE